MKTKRVSGWAIPKTVKMRRDKFIHLETVCTCKRHKVCESEGKRCQWLGGVQCEWLLADRLKKEMGAKFPEVWGRRLFWSNRKQYRLRAAAYEALRHTNFKRCRPVTVEVKGR